MGSNLKNKLITCPFGRNINKQPQISPLILCDFLQNYE